MSETTTTSISPTMAPPAQPAPPPECMINNGIPDEPLWLCPCGNGHDDEGHSACDASGARQVDPHGAPALEWDGVHLACNDCGRIFRVQDGVIVGRLDHHAAFDAKHAAWAAAHAAALVRVNAGLRVGSEWRGPTNSYGHTSYLAVLPCPGKPALYALRRFDNEGFCTHTEHAWDELPEAIIEKLGTKAQPAPGALDRLTPGFNPPYDFLLVVKGVKTLKRFPCGLRRGSCSRSWAGAARCWPRPACRRLSCRQHHTEAVRRAVLAFLHVGKAGGWHWWRQHVWGIRQDADWQISCRKLYRWFAHVRSEALEYQLRRVDKHEAARARLALLDKLDLWQARYEAALEQQATAAGELAACQEAAAIDEDLAHHLEWALRRWSAKQTQKESPC